MNARRTTLGMLALLASLAVAKSAPAEWNLLQNDPDPYCNRPEGATTINYSIDTQSEALLEVFYPDTSSVARVLVDGVLMAGQHAVIWDGRDDAGGELPDGYYPYRLIATEPGGGQILYQETRLAQIYCVTPADDQTWGRIKSLYR